MKKEELIEKWNYLDLSEKMGIVNSINSYDNSLEDLCYYENDEDFFNTYFNDCYEVARAISYGEYNFMDAYVHLNVYGNLESITEYGLSDLIDDYKEEVIDLILESNDKYSILCYFEGVTL